MDGGPLAGTIIETDRLRLVPLVAADADELVGVLDDPALHAFIGGEPATLDALRARYERMVAGPEGDDERWRNWVVRRRSDGRAVGTVQATLVRAPGGGADAGWRAEVAWVIGTTVQGTGYGAEAATALVERLAGSGVERVAAHIHPDHHASAGVARRAGLSPTDRTVDGERVWER